MSTTEPDLTDPDEVDDDDDNEPVDPDSPQELRKAAKRGRKAQDELAKLQRENALLRSGVDVSTPLGRFFAENYSGEMDPTAIAAAAAELGLGTEAPPPPAADADNPDPTGSQARKRLAAESVEHEAPTEEDPYKAGWDGFQNDLRNGRNRQDASAAWFDKVIGAASRGDDRVLINPADQMPREY